MLQTSQFLLSIKSGDTICCLRDGKLPLVVNILLKYESVETADRFFQQAGEFYKRICRSIDSGIFKAFKFILCLVNINYIKEVLLPPCM